jgi:uncharacterized membrane protein YphA (DoxX/SURF4 family)
MEANLLSNSNWKISQKIYFRFFTAFFILYFFPWPLNNIPFGTEINKLSEKILGWYNTAMGTVAEFWQWLIPLIGKYILHLKNPITTFTNGSGDTTYDYVLLFTQLFLAIVICCVWGLLDNKRKNYNTGYYWLCVLVRYFLAGMMLGYGFSKVFHLQMPYPTLGRLVQPYGDSSPMGLVWTYVGQSKAFSAFVGWSEVTCGLLLLFRKTTLLGAILCIIVMGNVVAINFCYDVPVKLFSSVLELMALFLVFPYCKKIFQIFTNQKAAVLQQQAPPVFTKKWASFTVKALKFLFIADALFYGIKGNMDNQKEYGDSRPKSPLYGIYNVKYCIKNNDTIPLLLTDTTLWKQLVFDSYKGTNACRIKLINDTVRRYNFEIDTILKTAVFYPNWDTVNKAKYKYNLDAAYLTFKGSYKKDSVTMLFERYDEKKFLLMNRGFHWVNEMPFNR